jgi:hypothetical protein
MAAAEFQPRWVLVEGGQTRCQECGRFVGRAWHWFEKVALSTRCYCEECAARIVGRP